MRAEPAMFANLFNEILFCLSSRAGSASKAVRIALPAIVARLVRVRSDAQLPPTHMKGDDGDPRCGLLPEVPRKRITQSQ